MNRPYQVLMKFYGVTEPHAQEIAGELRDAHSLEVLAYPGYLHKFAAMTAGGGARDTSPAAHKVSELPNQKGLGQVALVPGTARQVRRGNQNHNEGKDNE